MPAMGYGDLDIAAESGSHMVCSTPWQPFHRRQEQMLLAFDKPSCQPRRMVRGESSEE
jgi:hypothetical protein